MPQKITICIRIIRIYKYNNKGKYCRHTLSNNDNTNKYFQKAPDYSDIARHTTRETTVQTPYNNMVTP